MFKTVYHVDEKAALAEKINALMANLGRGRVDRVAYDTAWVARLTPHYPEYGFGAALEWLRRNQYDDGTWGAPLVHYHDRFISTLAAIVALQDVGTDPRDKRRIKRGEDALWQLVGKLGRDDSDTVGFPILSAALVEEATALGLDVPRPPTRYAEAYRGKVAKLLNAPERKWRESTLTYSLEALCSAVREDDDVFEENCSVSISPAATSAYLMRFRNENGLRYLQAAAANQEAGSIPAFEPVDIFDIVWSLNHLKLAGAVEPDDPRVRQALDYLWERWSPVYGITSSSYYPVPDVDVTSACYVLFRWAGYPVTSSPFHYYETDEHFCCYVGETNPSLSAHVRLLVALRECEEGAQRDAWIAKTVKALRRFDENGSFWWDKWHSSPYYVNSMALRALSGLADDLAHSRLKWILRTQNDDGGWGYLGESTPEETAYCLEALLLWDRNVEAIEPAKLDAAAQYLGKHTDDARYAPLWVGKSLYIPIGPVKASILSALFAYISRD